MLEADRNKLRYVDVSRNSSGHLFGSHARNILQACPYIEQSLEISKHCTISRLTSPDFEEPHFVAPIDFARESR